MQQKNKLLYINILKETNMNKLLSALLLSVFAATVSLSANALDLSKATAAVKDAASAKMSATKATPAAMPAPVATPVAVKATPATEDVATPTAIKVADAKPASTKNTHKVKYSHKHHSHKAAKS
jgi:hypothetical protein